MCVCEYGTDLKRTGMKICQMYAKICVTFRGNTNLWIVCYGFDVRTYNGLRWMKIIEFSLKIHV